MSDEDPCTSSDFDPLKALYAKKPPDKPKPPGVCLFDNLASLEGYFKRTGENLEEKFDKTKRTNPLSKKVPILKGEVVQRRFEPHQQMIHVGPKIRMRNERSVLTFMDRVTGPQSLLRTWKCERARVKILIRKNHGIRGTITGQLRLFDRHWNLVLTDCEEIYKRRKFRYANELCAATATEEKAMKRLKELGLEHPLKNASIKALKERNKKWVEIKRTHPLLLIKGDQVAVVLKATGVKTE